MINLKHHDFSSLSLKDLLEAREAYHTHLSHLDQVYATAIGKYLIRDQGDRNATRATAHSDPDTLGPRTLTNASIKDWSWPCVLVFVRKWHTPASLRASKQLMQEMVPPFLYMPDGRVVPTCVVEVDPDRAAQRAPQEPVFKSDLVGGGFPVAKTVQGRVQRGSIGCMVTDGDVVYALTNRHVTGKPGSVINAAFKNTDRVLGVSDALQLGKQPFAQVYDGWPGLRVMANLDVGLIRIADVTGWSAQVYGLCEIGEIWDLNVDTFRLDIIGLPVIAFGAVSGLMKGKILGLFYRYKSVGGLDYVSDFVFGPRDDATPLNNYPGDSGTLWFEDDPHAKANAQKVRILRPLALEWGGQTLLAPGARHGTQLALGACLATICRELDVEIITGWNVGHTEYWGENGHIKIGADATTLIDPAFSDLAALMQANAENIGLNDAALDTQQTFHHGDFAPLADVADLVWRFSRKSDENNHFADMDKPGPDGKSLLDLCTRAENVNPDVWNAYYDAIGEDRRGALPFRVWQIAEAMVVAARQDDWLRFVCAGGCLAHYVGDACQPLHISQFHHGRDPGDPKHAKVHSIYETTMIGRFGRELVTLIAAAPTPPVAEIAPGGTPSGHDIAVAVVALMQRTVRNLPPLTIVDEFEADMGRSQVQAMWNRLKQPTALCMRDGALTLARIWEAAWRAASSPRIPAGAGAFDQDALAALYNDKTFLPAFRLQDTTVDAAGHIVPRIGPMAATAMGRRARR